MAETQPLSVLIVAGFLGAGKTSLVNQVLRQAQGQRFVVFVNDFGALNIDLDLVETVSEDRIDLSNGCVCCSINGDFVARLADFARAADPPDAVLIETSGVADPRALEASLVALESARLIRLSTRVYLIDSAGFFDLDPALQEEVIDHAAACDLLLLNKIDQAQQMKVADLEETFRVSAPYAQICRTIRAQLPLALLFDSETESKGPRPSPAPPAASERHEIAYERWSATWDQAVDRMAFNRFCEHLSNQALRAKGLLRFTEEPSAWWIFHLVGRRATLERAAQAPSHAQSRLIAIGLSARLEVAGLQQAFDDLAGVVATTAEQLEPW